MLSGSRGKRGAPTTISGLCIKGERKCGRYCRDPCPCVSSPGSHLAVLCPSSARGRTPAAAELPRGSGAAGRGQPAPGPRDFAPLSRPWKGRAPYRVGCPCGFFAALSGEPRAAGLLPPCGWLATEHPVTPSQARDGHLGQLASPPPRPQYCLNLRVHDK